MLKKVIYSIVAGSLVLATQVASADDTQFWTGDRYQGVSALPFDAFTAKADARGDAVASKAQTVARPTGSIPAPYDTPGGYFN